MLKVAGLRLSTHQREVERPVAVRRHRRLRKPIQSTGRDPANGIRPQSQERSFLRHRGRINDTSMRLDTNLSRFLDLDHGTALGAVNDLPDILDCEPE